MLRLIFGIGVAVAVAISLLFSRPPVENNDAYPAPIDAPYPAPKPSETPVPWPTMNSARPTQEPPIEFPTPGG